MQQVQPYHQFKTAIANKLMEDNIFNLEWFNGQESRLNMFWLNGETPASAYDVIGTIAYAKFSGMAYSSPSIASLAAAGCSFEVAK